MRIFYPGTDKTKKALFEITGTIKVEKSKRQIHKAMSQF